MGFVSSMFGSGSGSGFQAQGVPINDPTQVDPRTRLAYGQANSAINQQAKFLQALAGQNGIQNQSSVFNQLQGVANGTGPNPAAAQLAQSTGANVANQAALIAGQRGANANAGLIARQAAMQGAGMQQQAAGQAAALQAQQSMNALGQLGSMAGQQVGQQQQALQGYNQFAQSQQQNLAGNMLQAQGQQVSQQNSINAANAGIAQGNQQAQQGLLGGAIGGAGSLIGLAHGGTIPTQYLAAGGSAFGPQSFIGRAANSAPAPLNPIASGFSSFGPGLRSAFFSNPAPVAPGGSSMSDYQALPDLQAPGSNSFDYMNLPNANAPQFTAEQALSQPQMTAGVPSGTMMASDGGKVPGKPKVFGDSQVNDVVPAKLSPGEIVIPRSVLESADPVRGAAEFVANELKKTGGVAQKKMAAGGTAADDQESISSSGGGSQSGKPPVVVNVNSAPAPEQQQQAPAQGQGTTAFQRDMGLTPEKQQQIANFYAQRRQQMGSGIAPAPAGASQLIASNGPEFAPSSSASPGLATGAGDAGTAEAPVNSDPFGDKAYSGSMLKGLNQQAAGITGEAAAVGALGKEQAAIEQQNQSRLAQLQQDYQQNYSKLDQERAAFQHDIDNSHIDPNKYVGNMDFGQKTKTAIGLILGGIGGGLLHQENPALKYLQSNIDRDIEAQKADLGKKENLLSMNMRQFGNLDQATNMTRLQQMSMVESQLKQAAAKAQDPIAKQRALQALGPITQQIGATTHALAMDGAIKSAQRGAGGASQIDPADLVRRVLPKEEHAEAFKELKEYQDKKSLTDNLNQAFNTVKNNRTVFQSPTFRSAAQNAMNAGIAELSKDATGRFNSDENAKLEKQFKPGFFDNPESIQLRLREMNRQLAQKANYPRLQKLMPFLEGTGGGSQMSKFQEAPETKTVRGVKYKRGPNGEAIPVT